MVGFGCFEPGPFVAVMGMRGNMRRTVAVAGVVVVAGLALAGCQKSSYSCRMNTCDVSVSGDAEVDFDSSSGATHGMDDRPDPAKTFTVLGYERNAVRLGSLGDRKTIRTGESAQVGEMHIKVVSVSGESAELQVQK